MATGLGAFVEINANDEKNKTQHLVLGTDVTRVNYTPKGTEVTIGVGGEHAIALSSGKKRAFLIIVDSDELTKVLKKG